MIKSFKSKPLGRYWTKNDAKGIRPDWIKRVRLILSRLDASQSAAEMDLPGLKFLALTGDEAGRFSVLVLRNWRITFGRDGEDAIDVELEDYHGR